MRRAPSHSLLGPALLLYLVADAASAQGQLDLLGALIAAVLGLLSLSSVRMAHAEQTGSRRVAWLGPAAACSLLATAAPHGRSLAVELGQAFALAATALLVLDLALSVPDGFFAPSRTRKLRLALYLACGASALSAAAAYAPALSFRGQVWLVPVFCARAPAALLVFALGCATWLRALRRRLSSSEEALASNAWAIFGLLPAIAVVVAVGLAELVGLSPREGAERIALVVAGCALFFGHLRMCDPSRRPSVGPITRDAVAAVLALAAGVAACIVARPTWPHGELALAGGAVGLLLFVAVLFRALREFARVALAPFGGRLLLALERAQTPLAEATDLEAVTRAALCAAREAAGDASAQPVLFLLDPPVELRIDAAGQPHRHERPLHPILLAALRERPNQILLRAPLEAQMVRKPALRALIDALVALDVLCVLPIYQREELEAALLVPRGPRRSRLTLEELAALTRFGRRLAGFLSVLCAEARSWRRASAALASGQQATRALEASESERARMRAQIEVLQAGELDVPSIAYSQSMRALLARLDDVAASSTPVLLVCERGTALTPLARRLHDTGGRGARPFVTSDCSAPRTEDTHELLFGEAAQARKGLLELAGDGTLLLTELPALSLAAQRALAAAMGERKLRIVASCRRDPDALVKEGVLASELRERFRVRLRVPPLRERSEDLPSLCLIALDRSARVLGRAACGLDPEAQARVLAYDWPGNQVELEAVIERAVAFAETSRVSLRELTRAGLPTTVAREGHPLDGSLERVERRALRRALERTSGNKSEAARLLGLKRTTFLDMLRRHGLDQPRASDAEVEQN